MNSSEIVAALSTAVEGCGAETPGFPPAKTLPSITFYPEDVPFAVTEPVTFIGWMISGAVDSDSAWELMGRWTSDDDELSINAAIMADQFLGGVVSNITPTGIRNIGRATLASGKDVVQAEAVFSVLR